MNVSTERLERFVTAQAPVIDQVLAELRQGRKTTHWMWFVFPQLAGLGRSATARLYALDDLDDARAYATHPVLGPRLLACSALVLAAPAARADAVFAPPDDLKLHSCMTLFARAVPGEPVFRQVLDRWFAGQDDAGTVDLLAAHDPRPGAPRHQGAAP